MALGKISSFKIDFSLWFALSKANELITIGRDLEWVQQISTSSEKHLLTSLKSDVEILQKALSYLKQG